MRLQVKWDAAGICSFGGWTFALARCRRCPARDRAGSADDLRGTNIPSGLTLGHAYPFSSGCIAYRPINCSNQSTTSPGSAPAALDDRRCPASRKVIDKECIADLTVA